MVPAGDCGGPFEPDLTRFDGIGLFRKFLETSGRGDEDTSGFGSEVHPSSGPFPERAVTISQSDLTTGEFTQHRHLLVTLTGDSGLENEQSLLECLGGGTLRIDVDNLSAGV